MRATLPNKIEAWLERLIQSTRLRQGPMHFT